MAIFLSNIAASPRFKRSPLETCLNSTRRSVRDPSLAITLSQRQEDVLKIIKDGTSIFLTGSAGTGKSLLLRKIIKYLHSVYDPGQLAVTASTGLASTKIKGTTLHSWAGIGLGKAGSRF
ncbi:uncharacterized protein LAESUDRAFT_726095 [Laetiporus sulphureus 93-53]|uniref:ATP-dependent DNA helicase n=1 Tax=Laetiporus sulphureus 93-53 TaxID=1314785 RepID=A0A165E5D1_9APHY|nr:uncharacterized protein LAESUDRAFT_726095 [Laetiporus sulphureus 93-53]KZT06269.1 hypothetical protein LAESUDRAFT_726095 [Laetiporus sulphureus 93-53]